MFTIKFQTPNGENQEQFATKINGAFAEQAFGSKEKGVVSPVLITNPKDPHKMVMYIGDTIATDAMKLLQGLGAASIEASN